MNFLLACMGSLSGLVNLNLLPNLHLSGWNIVHSRSEFFEYVISSYSHHLINRPGQRMENHQEIYLGGSKTTPIAGYQLQRFFLKAIQITPQLQNTSIYSVL